MNRLKNPHPGEMLRLDVLEPLSLTDEAFAKKIDVPIADVQEILDGKRPISADFALRLARYLGTPAQFWLGLQRKYDEEEVRRADPKAYEHIQPREHAAA